jgi:uncharacterized protein YmfQ (DUF2313 family)
MKRHDAIDYLLMFLGLQPRGLAWNVRLDSNWAKLWLADADGMARLEGKGFELVSEANPLSSMAALEDWERVLNLPDECSKLGESLEQRRATVIAKLQRPGGQSIDFFLKYLAPYGDRVEIQESYPPFLASVSVATDRTWELATGSLADGAGGAYVDYYRGWNFVWTVTRINHDSRRFRAGRNLAGEPLVIWHKDKDKVDPDLECRINKLKPAHTAVVYVYAVDREG